MTLAIRRVDVFTLIFLAMTMTFVQKTVVTLNLDANSFQLYVTIIMFVQTTRVSLTKAVTLPPFQFQQETNAWAFSVIPSKESFPILWIVHDLVVTVILLLVAKDVLEETRSLSPKL
jgi:hypothetical protein